MKALNFALLLCSVVLISSCSRYKGRGPVVSRDLTLEVFEQIDLTSSIEVFVSYGAEQTVIVEGNANIIDRLKTEVKNGTWKIGLKPGSYRKYDLAVYITSPNLKSMKVSGSGRMEIDSYINDDLLLSVSGSGSLEALNDLDVAGDLNVKNSASGSLTVNQLAAKDVDANLSGSGSITLAGLAETAVLKVSSSGSIRAFGLVVEECTAVNSGSGLCEISVINNLDATVSGSGSIRYKGNPVVTSKVSGSGSVVRN